MCWWAFTGLTHLLIEGPFVFTPDFFTKTNPNYFDEVCKLMCILTSSPGSSSVKMQFWGATMAGKSLPEPFLIFILGESRWRF
jgi:hypothetical protein